MSASPLTEILESLFAEVQELASEPESNWTHVGEISTFQVSKKKYKAHPIEMTKVTGVLKLPIGDVLSVMDNLQERQTWDKMCHSAKLVQQTGDVSIHHIELASMPLISSRDMVYATSHRLDPSSSTYLGVSRSLPLPDSLDLVPLRKKGMVRMDIIFSGSKLESCKEGGKECTKVTFMGVTDPKGLIPNVNLKTVAMKSASFLCNLQEHLYKKHGIKDQ